MLECFSIESVMIKLADTLFAEKTPYISG